MGKIKTVIYFFLGVYSYLRTAFIKLSKRVSRYWPLNAEKYPFRFVWYFFFLFLGLCSLSLLDIPSSWNVINPLSKVLLTVFVIFLIWKPMNVVYGLIGTRGSITMYLSLLVLINLLFSISYYVAFFHNAGISYDINQPNISYDLFEGNDCNMLSIQLRDTTYSYDMNGNKVSFTEQFETHNYQRIEFSYVLKNTLMTSLMQEPSDFFAIASTYNSGLDDFSTPVQIVDKEKSELFHWVLILQVFVSWIFFGVFISILYNKFRYES